mgnify:CR=1 FL=1
MEIRKPKTFSLNLSDADIKQLFLKTGISGITPEELLENFISDLLDGEYSNGSDERMYAQQWFDRCCFDSINENNSFLNYILNEYGDYAAKEIYELTVVFSENESSEDIEEYKKELEEYETYYKEYTKLNPEHNSFHKEIAFIAEWYKNMNSI